MFSQDRNTLRRQFIEAWQRHRDGLPLEPLQQQIVDLVGLHPEYHALLEGDPERTLARDWTPEQGETNPFLHLSMHLALREQIATDRPQGIRALAASLTLRTGDRHEAEHRMLDCLGEALWQAQRSSALPDEQAYLDCLRRQMQ